jgi:tetratricopeptide (TPR) repeat protein
MPFWRSAIVLGALTLAVPAIAQDWKGTGRLEGKVLDPDGKPVSDVVVKLENPERGGGPTTKTDKKGKWAVLGLAAGDWNVDFEAPGYAPKKGQVKLASESARIAPIEIRLEKAVAAGPPPEVAEAIAKGDAAYKAGDWAAARAEYEKLYALRPDLGATLLIQIARCYKEEGNVDKEIEYLQRVIAADPANNNVKMLVAMELIEAARVDEGVAMLEGMDQSAITQPDVFYNVGVSFRNKDKPEQAIAYFSKAIALDPAYVDGYFQRAMTYFSLQKLAEAKTDFQKVVELAPAGPQGETSKKVLEQLK